jgi:hypothetical protein
VDSIRPRTIVFFWLSADHADDEEVVSPFNRTTDELTFDVGAGG